MTVNAGTFGDSDITTSGAFISGTSEQQGTAEILGGTFTVGGQAGFSIFDYANVTFGEEPGSNTENSNNNNITVSGTAAGIAVENREAPVTITIYGDIDDTFASTATSGNSDGIWYANSNAQLTITGGTFTGAARAGLCFEKFPNPGKVQLSGGTYIGVPKEYRSWGLRYYKFGAIGYDAQDYGYGSDIVDDPNHLQLREILAAGAGIDGITSNRGVYIHRDVSKHPTLTIKRN